MKIYLNKNISRRVELGRTRIFANEVNRGKALDAAAKPGEIVNVLPTIKKFIGRGYINPQSQIMVRLLTRDKDELIDEGFFSESYPAKHGEYRQRIGYTENCRLIFGR